MLVEQKEKLQNMGDLVDNIVVDFDVNIEYLIPGILVTKNVDSSAEKGGPYVELS